MPDVTVLIPTHDHGELLRHSVRSCLWQTVQPSEILIVGDGVTMATRAVALELAKTDSRIRFYDFPKTGRTGEQHRNVVLKDTASDIICYLSDDDLWFPNHIETVSGLLASADFASSMHLSAQPDRTIVPAQVDLSNGYYRRKLNHCANRVPLSAAAHTLKSFQRLPFGWRATPPGIATDTWMWTQFARHHWVRMVSGEIPTVIWLPSPVRIGLSIEQRAMEMAWWEAQLSDPARARRINRPNAFVFSWIQRSSVRPAAKLAVLPTQAALESGQSRRLEASVWEEDQPAFVLVASVDSGRQRSRPRYPEGVVLMTIQGVDLLPLKTQRDDRGSLTELFRESWINSHPVQWNFVRSEEGVLRGVHGHFRHSDYMVVIEGTMTVGLKDMRPGSPSRNQTQLIRLHGGDLQLLTIPCGVAHGFYHHAPATFIYAVTHYWDTEDELGCRWDDPALGIPWPCDSARISSRDAALPSFAQFRHQMELGLSAGAEV